MVTHFYCSFAHKLPIKGGASQQESRNVEIVGGARRRTRTRDAQSRMNRRANYNDDDDDDDYDGGNYMLIYIYLAKPKSGAPHY